MMKKKTMRIQRLRLLAIILISLFVISTGTLFAKQALNNGDLAGGILGIIIAVIILIFAVIIYQRGCKDIKGRYPLHDERSRKVMQKASSMAFYVTLYMLLLIGFLSDNLIPFRDISQATSISVGLMAILFLIFWAYYNRKEI